MRLLIRLRARRDTAYDNTYHHKLRGRVWRALEDSGFDELHDEGQPSGLCFSNPFPPGDMEEGDPRTLLVAAPDRDLLGVIADDFDTNPEVNIGEMPFHVDDVTSLEPDVGEQVQAGSPVISVLGQNDYEVEVDISEVDIDKVEEGDVADITLDAFGEDEEFKGEVFFIDPDQTVIQGVVYYEVKLKLVEVGKEKLSDGPYRSRIRINQLFCIGV